MYYKVIRNQKIIDVLDSLQYCKFQLKHKTLLLCNKAEAQGILSSNGETAYHTSELLRFPTDIFPTVTLEEIDKTEYDRLQLFHLSSPQELAETIIKELMERKLL